MKKSRIHAKSPARVLAILLLLAAATTPAHAQFFKDVLNTVKNTAQGRANNQASSTTNKAIDKTTGIGSNSSNNKTPDTSAAGMMKMLGVMTGGGGVSAADSATAINSFKQGSGGSGYSYQYLMATTSKQQTMKDTSYRWLTNDGEGRSEMKILMPGVASGKLIVIGHASQPGYSILLDPDNKGYSLAVIDTALINNRQTTYKITKVGNETVDGYSCVHVKVTSTTGSGLFKSSSTEDLWTSTAVPGFALYEKLCDQTVNFGMMKALEQAGAAGTMVKMTASGKDYSMSYDLIEAKSGSYPASLFTIPDGYTNNHKTIMEYMLAGAMPANAKH